MDPRGFPGGVYRSQGLFRGSQGFQRASGGLRCASGGSRAVFDDPMGFKLVSRGLMTDSGISVGIWRTQGRLRGSQGVSENLAEF